jgi:hypothetical protein
LAAFAILASACTDLTQAAENIAVPPTSTPAPLPTPTAPLPTPTDPPPAPTMLPQASWPSDIVQNFMDSCVASARDNGSPNAQRICACVLDDITRRYTVQQFSRVEVDLTQGRPIPDDVLNIVADCRVTAR